MGYRLGIDVGTTYTAAAVVTDGNAQMLGLGNRALQVPTVLFFKADGEVLVGEAAEARGTLEPLRLVREFKRRLGDPVPILVAGSPQSPQSLIARMLSWVVASATTSQGGPPDEVTVTHPANWGEYKLDLFRQALRMAELDGATTRTEPAAAAISYASRNRMSDGDVVVVYDLGGGTFDVAVLRRSADSFENLGEPEGIEHLGGVDFDEAVFRHVVAALPEGASALDPEDQDVRLAISRLRRDCVLAKEALSADTETLVPVALPGITTSVRLTRTEFEQMVAPTLTDTVRAVRRALTSADLEPEDVSTFVLVGGSSRIPLVSERLVAEFGRPVAIDTHPKHEIALGAAIANLPAPQPRAADPEPVPAVDAPTQQVGDLPTSQPPSEVRPPWLRRRGPVVGGAMAAVALVVVVVAAVLGNGGDGKSSSTGPTTASSGSKSSTSPPPINPGAWIQRPNQQPEGTFWDGTAGVDHKLNAVTGQTKSGASLPGVRIFDPATNAWTTGPADFSLDHAGVASDGTALYVAGGQSGALSHKVASNKVYRRATPTSPWTSLEPLPAARVGGVAVWDGTSLVYAGGFDAKGRPHDDVWRLVDGHWKPLPSLSVARGDIAGVSDGEGTVWLIGGGTDGTYKGNLPNGRSLADIDIINGDSTSQEQLQTPIRMSAAVYVPGVGPCLFGGFTTAESNKVLCLPVEGPATLPVLPSARFGASAALIDGTVYLLGGRQRDGMGLHNLISLDLVAGTTPTTP
jgi:actin-like ATPase involved in cell morphogenesis